MNPSTPARLLRDTSGNVLMITALCFIFLVGIGGAGYDLGQQQLVRQKLQQAADASALGGASILGMTKEQRENTANILYQLNFPDTYLGVDRPTPVITVVDDVHVTVQAATTVNTSFVGNFNIETLEAKGASTAQIRQSTNKIDLVLVLDNSGSMRVKDAGPTYLLSPGAGVLAACQASSYPLALCDGTGAVAPNPLSISVEDTGNTRINALRYAVNNSLNKLMNPNPDDNRVAVALWDGTLIGTLPFTNTIAGPIALNSTLFGRGQTDSRVGMTQAQTWLNNDARPDAVKAVVLMTDGANYAQDPSPPNAVIPEGVINAGTVAICNAIKSRPRTLIFTIAFGNDVNAVASARQYLSDCASPPNGNSLPNENLYFYRVSNGEELNTAFQKIIGNLQAVRIVN